MNLIFGKSKSIAGILMLIMMTLMLGTTFTVIESSANGILGDGNLVIGSDGTVHNKYKGEGTNSGFGRIIDKYQKVITFFSGIAAITMVGVFIFNFTKLGTTSTNPSERQKVITGLIFSGIAAALLGSVTLVVGVFYGMLK